MSLLLERILNKKQKEQLIEAALDAHRTIVFVPTQRKGN